MLLPGGEDPGLPSANLASPVDTKEAKYEFEPESEFKIETVQSSLLEQMYDRISVTPMGEHNRNIDLERQPFRFYIDERGKYHVVLPRNLETFADDWMCIVAVACLPLLEANVEVGRDLDPSEIAVNQAWEPYLQGLAAALKLGSKNGIAKRNYSSRFRHAYNWIASQNQFIRENPRFFHTRWNDPKEMLSGRKVWKENPGETKKRWYDLVFRAAQLVKLDDPLKWIAPWNKVQNLFKTKWSFEKGSVFTERERAVMRSSISKDLAAYQDMVRSYKNDITIDMVRDFDAIYERNSRALLEYDTRIASIATQRSTILYSQKMKKKYGRGALTLEDRLNYLDTNDYIAVTNCTGLDCLENRIPFIVRDRNADPSDILGILEGIRSRIPSDAGQLTWDWIDGSINMFIREHRDYLELTESKDSA
jgi:hypothetical protein